MISLNRVLASLGQKPEVLAVEASRERGSWGILDSLFLEVYRRKAVFNEGSVVYDLSLELGAAVGSSPLTITVNQASSRTAETVHVCRTYVLGHHN
jgi:hypothetical protein